MSRLEMFEACVGYSDFSNKIDAEVASEGICECGRNKTYRGFIKGNSYRAFAVCDFCDTAEEF